ncbi:phosphoadenylyl-sulfate reductase [thioredoxin] [Sulfuriferula multivorans]|uniref:Phosphoadenylyl-sulfate reductase [thioredoxin] n=1 Tax=Sulfuriferula multivorans TaxID=1559896 RepID=A0A401JF66_9PROT|nr:phosphoadenosine phosphosulfate reductase family protein [Sulfuriferula multivorans]GBL46270.1 phosphoadenylyl-sulfate reductase [thioredoxin] [Sulfuriferula multivorans]
MRDALYRKVHAHRYRRAIDDAHAVIVRALQQAGDAIVAIGVSGGKDSVAMCHLVAQHCRPLIIYNDSGLEMPESLDMVRAVAERLELEIHIARGDAVALQAAGLRNYDAILEPVQRAIRERGVALEFVGLRRCESRHRRMLIGRYGPVHQSIRWGCLVAWPMRNWSSGDVFAYLDEYGLPVHPAYLRYAGIDRDAIRVSWAYDPDRHEDGDAEYVRQWYPALFRQLRDKGLL